MDNKEKLSAFYDNELREDAQELIKSLSDNEQLARDLKGYSLISSIMQQSRLSEPRNKSFSQLRLTFMTHSLAAAAAVFLTLGFITYFNPAQFDYDRESSQLLADAIASEEGQIRLNQEEDLLVDHLFHIMDEKNLNSNMNPGWVPVGLPKARKDLPFLQMEQESLSCMLKILNQALLNLCIGKKAITWSTYIQLQMEKQSLFTEMLDL